MLENCQPQEVFSLFEQFCAVPHGSGHTEGAGAFCLAFAEKHDLDATRDAAGNVLIRKPATLGYEDAPAVILQGHLDMVAEKEPDCPLDLMHDGLSLFVDGDYVGARGTTLGGDDGIAVAMVLAILADRDAPHPALEAVFTTDEEIGMLGADAMDMSCLRGRYLLNLDSEDEGILTVSCAGGARTDMTLPVCREKADGTLCTLTLDGMRGGHSGTEIHRGRLNADKLLVRILAACAEKTDLRLVTLEGGSKDNAIPCRATATFFAQDACVAEQIARTLVSEEKALHAASDPDVTVTFSAAAGTAEALSRAATRAWLGLLDACPCGVQKMSADIAGLVQTSLNLGIMRSEDDCMEAVFSVRSSVEAEKDALIARLETLAGQAGATFRAYAAYPAWEYRRDSHLRDTVCAVYRGLYGKEMQIEAIHAGLECGLFASRVSGLDCVSFGPDMRDIHTTRERLSISSVARTYTFVKEILRALR